VRYGDGAALHKQCVLLKAPAANLALETQGKDVSKKAFAPGDNTHHNNYGSYELAKCIVEGIKAAKLPLAKFIVEDFTSFDPARPDPIESFAVPASPSVITVKPDGN